MNIDNVNCLMIDNDIFLEKNMKLIIELKKLLLKNNICFIRIYDSNKLDDVYRSNNERVFNIKNISFEEINIWIKALFIEWKQKNLKKISSNILLEDDISFDFDENSNIRRKIEKLVHLNDQICDLAFGLELICDHFPPRGLLTEAEFITGSLNLSKTAKFCQCQFDPEPHENKCDCDQQQHDLECFIICLMEAIEICVGIYPRFSNLVDVGCEYSVVQSLEEKGFRFAISSEE